MAAVSPQAASHGGRVPPCSARELLERAKAAAGRGDVVVELGSGLTSASSSAGADAARPRGKNVMSRMVR